MKTFDFLIGLSWIVFWVYWIAQAANTLKNRRSKTRSRLLRGIFFLPMMLAIYLTLHDRTLAGYQISAHRLWLKVLGTILFYGGLGFAIWARRHLGSNWGVPMSVKENPKLITTGPYKLVRHPIYTGLLVASLGTFLALTFIWLLVFLITTAYFTYSAFQEDKIMARQFPKTYPAYKARTKMLIPYLF